MQISYEKLIWQNRHEIAPTLQDNSDSGEEEADSIRSLGLIDSME